MSTTIDKNDSAKKIREKIRQAADQKKKKKVDLNQYFGKVDFGMDGLEYQKK